MWQMNILRIDFHSMGIFSSLLFSHFFQSVVVVSNNRNVLEDTGTGHDCDYFDNRLASNRAR